MSSPWPVKTLDELINEGLITLGRGKIISRKDLAKTSGDYPVYSSAKQNDGKFGEYGLYMFDEELITWSIDGGGRLFHRHKHKFSVTNVGGTLRINDINRLNYKFLYYCLSLLHSKIDFDWVKKAHPSIIRKLYNEIPIPSLEEQQRIVNILNEAFTNMEYNAKQIKQKIVNVDKLYKTSLSKAVTGQLTNQYRSDTSAANFDLSNLLQKIGQVQRKPTRNTEETAGHDVVEEAIPSDWSVTSIQSLFECIDYRGKNPQKSEAGIRLITAKNVKMGFLSDEPKTFVSEEIYEKWMVRGFPKPNDIFFVTEGHTMGFVALNTRDDDFALAQRMITLQPAVNFDTKYFYYYMLSNYFQRLIRINATGATAKGMKSSRFRNLPLPFPSLQEQMAIVEKLDSLKAEIEKLNHTYQQELNNVDKFKHSILQEAFNGNL